MSKKSTDAGADPSDTGSPIVDPPATSAPAYVVINCGGPGLSAEELETRLNVESELGMRPRFSVAHFLVLEGPAQ